MRKLPMLMSKCKAALFFLMAIAIKNEVSGQANSKDSSGAINLDTVKYRAQVDSFVVRRQFGLPRDTVNMEVLRQQPYMSIQQMIKGNVAGVYVNENSGEPGVLQNFFIRGLSMPLLQQKDVYQVQPTIYVNGTPLFQGYPISYDIQSYDYNPIGPATNLYTILDPNNIEKIEVLKDAATLAKLGPNAANGAIWITTKEAHEGKREFSINSYYGIAQKPSVTPTNAAYENAFRKPFYDMYANSEQLASYPSYLSDSTDVSYYGPSNWVDAYYKNKPFHSVNASFVGGGTNANFRFQLGNTRNVGNADNVLLDRYNLGMYMNMRPISWLNIATMFMGTRLQRTRNTYLRDRYSETHYIPYLSNPLSPTLESYSAYLNQLNSKGVDDNKVNSGIANIHLTAEFKRLKISSEVTVDYNEGVRDYFVPSTIMSDNNYLSTYFGANQRSSFTNSISYDWAIDGKNKIYFDLGQNYQKDNSKYNYLFSYNTTSDFIKVRTVTVDENTGAVSITGLSDATRTTWPFVDKVAISLASFYGGATYSYNNILKAGVVVRRDGSSALQPNLKWKTSANGNVSFDIKELWLKDKSGISLLQLRAGIGQILRPFNVDKYSSGPSYVNDLGWGTDRVVGTFQGMAGITRPYRQGWVGYNIPWQYSLKRNIGLDFGFWNNRLKGSLDVYSNDDGNSVIGVPAVSESGYSQSYETGLKVNNKGVELSLTVDVLRPQTQNGISWVFNLNGAYNKNTLKALPNGLQELVIDDRKLVVGKSIDQFWIYENKGIYNSDAEVPTGFNFNTIDFKKGDPKWVDQNGDNAITDDDRILKGHYLPVVSGGFGSDLNWKGFNLNFQFQYALGNKLLNQDVQKRLDFVNNEGANDMNSIKEITFWQKDFDLEKYPKYNPWSEVSPYQLYQDLFLEDASYLKLRSLTFGYDFAKLNSGILKKGGFSRASVYVSATNIFTVSKFKQNPEYIDYQGLYTGYGLPMPRTFMAGIRLDF